MAMYATAGTTTRLITHDWNFCVASALQSEIRKPHRVFPFQLCWGRPFSGFQNGMRPSRRQRPVPVWVWRALLLLWHQKRFVSSASSEGRRQIGSREQSLPELIEKACPAVKSDQSRVKRCHWPPRRQRKTRRRMLPTRRSSRPMPRTCEISIGAIALRLPGRWERFCL